MANLKNITELPLAESSEGLNLIVSDGGAAKQIAASAVGAQADWIETDENSPAFIKNKPEVAKKELMYEWNFSAADEVYKIIENVEDDLTWLTVKNENIDYEIVTEFYGKAYDSDSGNRTIMNNTFSVLDSTHGNYEITNYAGISYIHEDDYIVTIPHVLVGELYGYDRFNGCRIPTKDDSTKELELLDYVYFEISSNIHYNDNEYILQVDCGGNFYFETSSYTPLKSVRIYKITN